MALRFRDRFFTPKVAKAITSPSAIVATGAGVAGAILLGLGPIGAVIGGAIFLGGRIGLAIPRAPRSDRIDPFTLAEPWRRLVQDALGARAQFGEAVRRAKAGPLRDRLAGIADQIDAGVEECWRVAQAGHALADARSRVDVGGAQRELAEVEHSGYANDTVAGTVEALKSQLAAATRMDTTIVETRDRLRLLNARLDEAVTRSIELSVSTSGAEGLDSVGQDVTSITQEMEALRQGLEATEGLSAGGTATGGAG